MIVLELTRPIVHRLGEDIVAIKEYSLYDLTCYTSSPTHKVVRHLWGPGDGKSHRRSLAQQMRLAVQE